MKKVALKEISGAKRAQTQTKSFALVVVRNPFRESLNFNKFLCVEEASNRGWWIAGGGVKAGETFHEAALREVREEAGIEVELKGILRYM